MKIGIMTWHQYYNYGTALQLVALSEVIRILNSEPWVINYHTREMGANGIHKSLWKKIQKKTDQVLYRNVETPERNEKFQEFYRQHLTFTERCDTLPELERLNDWLDGFVCGSDQIWSPLGFDPHYYLDFVTDAHKTIAYAPSVGIPEVSNAYVREGIKRNAGRIEHLSTREEVGSKIIANLTDREVKTVLDPTLLLSAKDWRRIAGDRVKDTHPYLLVYMLGHNELQWRSIYKIAKLLGLTVKIIPVFFNDFKRSGCITEPIGPQEFLSLVDGAAFVCTDSFHGTLFSIQFEKEFCVFERFKKGSENNQNSRIYNILKQLHLEKRLCTNPREAENIAKIRAKDLETEKLLIAKREDSLDYLKASLEAVAAYTVEKTQNNIKKDLTLCCGCGACMTVCPTGAISVNLDAEGFYSSTVDTSKCISCGKCRKVCPYIERIGGVDCREGELYAYKNTSTEVLMKSSSGGAGYAFGKLALDNNMEVAGCMYNTANQTAGHVVVTNQAGLCQLQGSKYMQSNFSNVAGDILEQEHLMVFGTPCQIAGARELCKGKDVVFIDLICHGVPSYYLFKSYKDYLQRVHGLDPNRLEVVFRYKPRGWRERYIYSSDSEKEVCNHQSKDPYFLSFEHGVCYSKNCFECPWRDRSQADIRIGDYWNPRFNNDKTGVSMIMTLTQKGKEWIERLEKSGTGEVEKTEITDYTNVQQMVNTSAPLFRAEVIEKLKSGTPIETVVNQYVMPLYRENLQTRRFGPIKQKLKKVIKRNG